MVRIFGAVGFFVTCTGPAYAGNCVSVTPGPEAGMGVAAMGLLGLSVAWLRKRRQR